MRQKVTFMLLAMLFCCVLGIHAQTGGQVSGKVVDAMGELPGVSVVVKGTTNGTTTDAKADWYEGLPTDEKNMLDYIMGAGTYGNVDNLVANKLGDDDDVKKSKFKYVFRRVFPDYKSFKKYHPLICRYKVLVPFGYLFRIIKLPFTGWKRAMAELKAVLRK